MLYKFILGLSIFVLFFFTGCKTTDDGIIKGKKQVNSIQQTQDIKEMTTNQMVIRKNRINQSLPEFIFKVYYQKKDTSYSVYRIEIYSNVGKKEKIQDILLSDTRTLDEQEFGTIIEDINFDGYKDIRVQCGTPPGPNIPYYYWLWDENSSRYVPNKELEEIVSPEINYKNETITSFNRGSASDSRERVYKYIDGKLRLIKETERLADIDKMVLHFTIKELIGNHLKIVKKYDKPIKIENR